MKKSVVVGVVSIVLLFILLSLLVLDTQKVYNSLPRFQSSEDHTTPKEPSERETTQRVSSGFEEESINNPTTEESLSEEEREAQSCIRQFSYAVSSFNQISSPPGLNCSLIVRNLEYDFSGDFQVKILLLDATSKVLASKEITHSIAQRQEALFETLFTEPTGTTCEYETLSVPRKSIC